MSRGRVLAALCASHVEQLIANLEPSGPRGLPLANVERLITSARRRLISNGAIGDRLTIVVIRVSVVVDNGCGSGGRSSRHGLRGRVGGAGERRGRGEVVLIAE